MISKDKITEIFCIADDFCKELEKEFAKKVLPDSDNAPKRHRKRMMSDAEVITILIVSTLILTAILSTIICIVYEQFGRIYFLKPFHTIVL